MEDNLDWNKEQFLAYILLYAGYADLQLSSDEEEYISSKVGEDHYQAIKKEFDSDSDKDRVYKIIAFSEGEEFDNEYTQMVMNDIEDLFLADGELSHWENTIGRALRRLMNI